MRNDDNKFKIFFIKQFFFSAMCDILFTVKQKQKKKINENIPRNVSTAT